MKKILIIEDNKDLQEIYRHSFEKDGYTVVSKDNGQDGYDAITTELPDVILLDLMMPGVNGFDFLQKLNSVEGITIPVIVCSNISDIEMINKAIQGGAAAVLLKVDYVGKQLVDKVNYLVEEFYSKKKGVSI
ncbi:MAG: response regulator [Candidatus Pacebacteria bacterium]|nr:response regulator [Candidatus Paceibacterota bacterium]